MDKLNEFEKARLIKVASRYASIKGYEHSNGDISYYSEKTEVSTETLIALAKLALASLTAPPVKLPKIKHPAQFDYADEVVEVLKSHGYEVEE